MSNTIIIDPIRAYKIHKSKKAFIVFNTSNNKLSRFVLTDDLSMHRNRYTNFRLLDIFKAETNIKF